MLDGTQVPVHIVFESMSHTDPLPVFYTTADRHSVIFSALTFVS